MQIFCLSLKMASLDGPANRSSKGESRFVQAENESASGFQIAGGAVKTVAHGEVLN